MEFAEKVKELTNKEYSLVGEYTGIMNRVIIRHDIKECGFEFEVVANNFMGTKSRKGSRCPVCGTSFKMSEKIFIEKMKRIRPNYSVDKFFSFSKKVKIKHLKCQHSFEISPACALDPRTETICPECGLGSGRKMNHEQFIKKVRELEGENYKVIGRYSGTHSHIVFRHIDCGTEFEMRPNNFIHKNNRCPKCTKSKGEEAIERWFNSNEIEFKTQFSIEGCKYKNILKFDFAVELEDGSYCIIEYDGRYHDSPHSKKKEHVKKWEDQVTRDKVKNDFCQKNGIELIRIHHSEFKNIDKILGKRFND